MDLWLGQCLWHYSMCDADEQVHPRAWPTEVLHHIFQQKSLFVYAIFSFWIIPMDCLALEQPSIVLVYAAFCTLGHFRDRLLVTLRPAAGAARVSPWDVKTQGLLCWVCLWGEWWDTDRQTVHGWTREETSGNTSLGFTAVSTGIATCKVTGTSCMGGCYKNWECAQILANIIAGNGVHVCLYKHIQGVGKPEGNENEPLKSCDQISDTWVLSCYSSRMGTANSASSAEFEQLQNQALAVTFPPLSQQHDRTLVWSGKDSGGASWHNEHTSCFGMIASSSQTGLWS